MLRLLLLFTYVLITQVNAAAEVIYDLVDPSANLIFGAVIDPSISGQVSCLKLWLVMTSAVLP